MNNANQINQHFYALNSDHWRAQKLKQQKYTQAVLVFMKNLSGQVMEVFRIWKIETVIYLINAEKKIRDREVIGQIQFIKLFNKIKNINDKDLLRHTQGALNHWKILTIIERKAENRKLQQYLLNNAKLEIQKKQSSVAKALSSKKHV